LILLVPLCLLKDINWLGFASFLSLLPLAYLFVLQIVYLAMDGMSKEPMPIVASAPMGAFVAFPIFVFAFSSQIALFSIYKDMREKGGTFSDVKLVVNWSIALTIVVYVVIPLLGVLAYPNSKKDNVMLDLPKGIPVDILLLTMALSIILSYPVFLFPMRDAMNDLIGSIRRKCCPNKGENENKNEDSDDTKEETKTSESDEAKDEEKGSEDDDKTKGEEKGSGDNGAEGEDQTSSSIGWCSRQYLRFVIETFIFIAITIAIGIGIPSFSTILGLSGSITKTLVCYIFPALFFLKSTRTPIKKDKWKISAVVFIVVGAIAGLVSAAATVMEYVEKQTNSTATNSTA